jgi:hypothetical protein
MATIRSKDEGVSLGFVGQYINERPLIYFIDDRLVKQKIESLKVYFTLF